MTEMERACMCVFVCECAQVWLLARMKGSHFLTNCMHSPESMLVYGISISILSLSLSLSQMFLCVCFTLNVCWFIVCAAFICYYWTSVAVKTKRLTFRTWCLAFVSWSCSSAVHNALLTAWLYACTEHTSLFPLTTPGLWIPFFHYVL